MTKAEGRTVPLSGSLHGAGMVLWKREHPKIMPHVRGWEGLPVEDPKHAHIPSEGTCVELSKNNCYGRHFYFLITCQCYPLA